MKKYFLNLAASLLLWANLASANPPIQTPEQINAPQPSNLNLSLEERFLGLRSMGSHKPLFDATDLELIKTKGIKLEDVYKLASMKFLSYRPIWDNLTLMDYILNIGDVKFAFEIYYAKKSDGDHIVSNASTITTMWRNKKNLPYLLCMANIVDKKSGDPVYWEYDIRVLSGTKLTCSEARDYANVLTLNCYPYFSSDGLKRFLELGGTAVSAKNFLNYYDKRGERLSQMDLVGLTMIGGNAKKFGRFLLETGLDIHSAATLFILGIEKKEDLVFRDTKKPNAVIGYAYYDWNNGVANLPERINLNKIRNAYDTLVLVVKQEGEFYDAIDRIPNISLLGANGHGDDNYFFWSELPVINVKDPSLEKFLIDPDDVELSDHLGKLRKDAIIYFNSCDMGTVLAGNIAKWSGGRTVIAPTSHAISDNIDLKVKPFNLRFYDAQGRDKTITYNSPEPQKTRWREIK